MAVRLYVRLTTATTGSKVQQLRQLIADTTSMGVKIASGYDPSSAKAHGRNARELIALHKLGMLEMEVIRTATTRAAELLGWQHRVGAIQSGKYADLVAVAGNPLEDLTELVMKGGKVVKNEFTDTRRR